MRRRRKGRGAEACGSASVELVGLLPALALIVLIAAQGVIAGYSLWAASVSARAGARAAHVGADPVAVAQRALPAALRANAEIRSGPDATGDGAASATGSVMRRAAGAVTASVAVPRLIPFLPAFRVSAATALEPDGG